MTTERLPELSKLVRDVLRLCAEPRKAGDIRFLMNDSSIDTAAVERALDQLIRVRYVEQSAEGLWRQSVDGRGALHQLDHWTLLVEDVLRITDRPRPIVVGALTGGVVYNDDWFLVNDQRLGRVVTVETVCGPNVRADAVLFTTDIELALGDVLTRVEPVAA